MSAEKLELLTAINPSIHAIFWIENSSLNNSSQYFKDLDYLFDGLISEYILNNSEKLNSATQVFRTLSFNQPLWLFHFHGSNLSSEVDEQIALLKSNSNLKIIVINKSNKKWEDELPKLYPSVQFILF